MKALEALQSDHAILTKILQDRRSVTMETLPVGMRMLWSVYLTILEDGIRILTALLDFLDRREEARSESALSRQIKKDRQ